MAKCTKDANAKKRGISNNRQWENLQRKNCAEVQPELFNFSWTMYGHEDEETSYKNLTISLIKDQKRFTESN
jgi:hypothetical protein